MLKGLTKTTVAALIDQDLYQQAMQLACDDGEGTRRKRRGIRDVKERNY